MMTTNRRGMLHGLLAGGVASLFPQSVRSAPRRLSTATLAKSVLILAEKATKAKLMTEATLLWELHKKLSLLPLTVEAGGDEDEEEPPKAASRHPRVEFKGKQPSEDPLGIRSREVHRYNIGPTTKR